MGRKTQQHKIVTSELWKNVSRKNKELLDGFIEYCRSTNKSNQTVDGYYNDIQIFMVWNLQYNNKFFIDFTKRDIIKYQNWLVVEQKLSSNRVRRLKSSLSSMSNYIENVLDDEFKDFRNIINKIPAPPSPTPETGLKIQGSNEIKFGQTASYQAIKYVDDEIITNAKFVFSIHNVSADIYELIVVDE